MFRGFKLFRKLLRAPIFQTEVFRLLRISAANVVEEIVLQLPARLLKTADELLVRQMCVVVEEAFLAADGDAHDCRHRPAGDFPQLCGSLIWLPPTFGSAFVSVPRVVEAMNSGMRD